jgi:hypothetical protein
LAIGAAVAEELYGVQLPIAVVSPAEIGQLASGVAVTIGPEGVSIS